MLAARIPTCSMWPGPQGKCPQRVSQVEGSLITSEVTQVHFLCILFIQAVMGSSDKSSSGWKTWGNTLPLWWESGKVLKGIENIAVALLLGNYHLPSAAGLQPHSSSNNGKCHPLVLVVQSQSGLVITNIPTPSIAPGAIPPTCRAFVTFQEGKHWILLTKYPRRIGNPGIIGQVGFYLWSTLCLLYKNPCVY